MPRRLRYVRRRIPRPRRLLWRRRWLNGVVVERWCPDAARLWLATVGRHPSESGLLSRGLLVTKLSNRSHQRGARCTARCCKANRRCEPGHRSNLRRGTSSGGPSRCGSCKRSNSRPRLSWHARNKRFRDPRSRGRQAMSPCPPGPDAKQRRQQQLDKQDLRRHHTLRRKGVLSLRHRRRHRSSLNHFRHQGAHSSLRCRLSDDPRRRDPAFCWTHRRPHAHAPHLCEPVLGAALAAEA